MRPRLTDQTGAMALMVVLMTSAVMITTLTTVYVYLVNRSRHHAQVKRIYDLQNVMEEAAKVVRQYYDQNNTVNAPTVRSQACPNGAKFMVNHMGQTYCFSQNTGTGKPTDFYVWNGQERGPAEAASRPMVDRWVSRVENYYDGAVSSDFLERRLIAPSRSYFDDQAYAQSSAGRVAGPNDWPNSGTSVAMLPVDCSIVADNQRAPGTQVKCLKCTNGSASCQSLNYTPLDAQGRPMQYPAPGNPSQRISVVLSQPFRMVQ